MKGAQFNSHTTKFDGHNAFLLAKASFAAYHYKEDIKQEVSGWGLSKFEFFNADETQAFMAGDEDTIILAFRGTEPTKLQDLMTDAKMEFTNGPGGRVHSGFLGGLEAVWSDIRNTLTEFQDNGQSLWVTGHSLGAALAVLAVANLGEEDKPIHGLYTFGQPRVGDKTFARNFNLDFQPITFRFVNNNDIVTRVPLRAQGFRHVGRILYIDVAGQVQDDINWWNRFLDRVKGRIEDLGKLGPDGIKDHSMEKGYVPNLARESNLKLVL